MKFATSLFLALCLASLTAKAQNVIPLSASTHSDAFSQEFYTLREPSKAIGTFSNPGDLLQLQATSLKNKVISLLRWVLHPEKMELPTEPYNRVGQFGRWINDPTDDTCMNTRAKILVRDSVSSVGYTNPRNCVVADGNWQDPYSGQDLTLSKQVQIDHVVPLKHAYLSGAWKWDYNTRCLYANFMGSKYHLKAVSGHENMSKGDSAPNVYMPPNPAFRCEYLKTWLKIKATWNLVINKDEAEAIQKLVIENHCKLNQFVISYKEISTLRKFIKDNINYCALNHR
jgi:hypothetical protein